MPVAAGTRLGPYEVKSPLGAGGMGEVYRATDTRLNRSVALKILPPEFAYNAQLRIRFEREAKTISQLNHPNICTLYDVGHENGTDYIVMELIEGETLADRLARAALPLDELLKIAIEIAEALDKAHRNGVVHRDLKPGNVMLTKSGAKLLDFGLASSAVIEVGTDGETVHKPLTQEGTIVGTFQYMSPEQLEGSGVDHRSDIFAFGAVLYEMATRRRAFEGKTKTSLIAAIVSANPAPVSQLQPLAPSALEHVIERCLEKDPDDRWQSARDIAEELRWIQAKGSQAGVAAPVLARRRIRERIAWAAGVIALLAALALASFVFTRPKPERIVTEVNAPPGMRFAFELSQAVVSPNGKMIAFVANAADGRVGLWLRPLSTSGAQKLTGTDGATFPFWSPDSRQIAFFADGKLKRVQASGGGVEPVADVTSSRGGSWGPNDVILFSPSVTDAVYRVSASGGDVRPVTKLGSVSETSHRFPSFLGDGIHFVYFIQGSRNDEPNVYLGSIEGNVAKPLLHADGGAIAAKTGELLYVSGGVLRARHFNVKKLAFDEEPVMIAEDVQSSTTLNYANVSVAENGTLTYVSGSSATQSRVVWVDRAGKEINAMPLSGEFNDPRLSPDGKRLAYAMVNSGHMNLYVYDIARRVSSRFTFSKVNEWGPAWSPDGQWIAYTSFENSPGDIHVKHASGIQPDRKIIASPSRKVVTDWPNPDIIFYHATGRATGWDLWTYSFREGRSRPYLQTPFSETGAHLSPNGKWVAYACDESGFNEVYVRSFDPGVATGKWQISTGGGWMPSWSTDGKELYYVSADQKLMAAKVLEDSATFAVDVAQPLMPAVVRQFAGMTRNQYSTRDGKVFVVNQVGTPATAASITVVQNWRAR